MLSAIAWLTGDRYFCVALKLQNLKIIRTVSTPVTVRDFILTAIARTSNLKIIYKNCNSI